MKFSDLGLPVDLGAGILRSGQFLIVGGSSGITTGQQPGFFICPFPGLITGVTLIANASGSIQLEDNCAAAE